MTTIVYGGAGVGKSRNAELLRKIFGETYIVDGWDGEAPLPSRALALTNQEPPYNKKAGARVFSFAAAMKLAAGARRMN